MKYNPYTSSSIPGFAGLHPLQGPEAAQGALELRRAFRSPAWRAAAWRGPVLNGELAGVDDLQAYHLPYEGRTASACTTALHGTNPAEGVDGRYEAMEVPSTKLAWKRLRHPRPTLAGL